jgi:hypothetical protein
MKTSNLVNKTERKNNSIASKAERTDEDSALI